MSARSNHAPLSPSPVTLFLPSLALRPRVSPAPGQSPGTTGSITSVSHAGGAAGGVPVGPQWACWSVDHGRLPRRAALTGRRRALTRFIMVRAAPEGRRPPLRVGHCHLAGAAAASRIPPMTTGRLETQVDPRDAAGTAGMRETVNRWWRTGDGGV